MNDNRPTTPHAGAAPDEDALLALAEAALATMPHVFRLHIAGLLLAIEDVADADTLAAMDIEHPYELTGLYSGRPLTEKSVEESGALPDTVTLYRLPILIEWIESGERLDHLIRHVLIHEIGHHFGFSDEDMDAIEDGD
ncbi:MAG: metallopeptidase family protein [Sphingopyxis sp.]|nr:metallopeptidase family protein [Sphingopyxis sp.]